MRLGVLTAGFRWDVWEPTFCSGKTAVLGSGWEAPSPYSLPRKPGGEGTWLLLGVGGRWGRLGAVLGFCPAGWAGCVEGAGLLGESDDAGLESPLTLSLSPAEPEAREFWAAAWGQPGFWTATMTTLTPVRRKALEPLKASSGRSNSVGRLGPSGIGRGPTIAQGSAAALPASSPGETLVVWRLTPLFRPAFRRIPFHRHDVAGLGFGIEM